MAYSSTKCKSLHHLSCHCIALYLIFPNYTLSPTFPNFESLLQQMEPAPNLVMNLYSQQKQEAHLERALTFMKAAHLDCPSNVFHPIICLLVSNCEWLTSQISVLNQNDKINQEIGDDDTEDTGEYTVSSDTEEDKLNHHQEVLHLRQTCRVKSVRTIKVPVWKKQSHANTVIPCPLGPNSRNLAAVMAPPLLKR